ncbi:hypothetical protein [Haliscomenobacter sp.]|uniref:hypothetical protein n=1 Tax=Haliscomenobacter sp. TaxID=2717303 RepID=UPI00336512E3
MSTIVIMPGGFHPFHAGHAALYNSARRAFPDAEVFVAATNDTSTRPFPFAVKEKLAKLAGVDAGHFVQVKSPFQAKEITSRFDPESDRLIFVRSEKDADKPPQAGGVKKDGNPSYLQPLLGATKLEPFARHAYMAYLPTVEFGPGMTSATEIRTAWPSLNEKRKTALVMSLYPDTQKNPRLAANVVAMLDTAIGSELAEGKDINPQMIDVFYRPVQNSRARRVVAQNIPASVLDRLLKKLSDKFGVPVESFEWEKADTVSEMDGQNFVGGMTASYQRRENQPVDEDYIDEKWSQKYKSSINCASPKGFSQKAHCAGRKK